MSPIHLPPPAPGPAPQAVEASCDPQEPAAGTSPRLPARSLHRWLRHPKCPRKFHGDSRSCDSTAHQVWGSLLSAPRSLGSPGAPANLTPPCHSGGHRAPLAMASLTAAAAPRRAPSPTTAGEPPPPAPRSEGCVAGGRPGVRRFPPTGAGARRC